MNINNLTKNFQSFLVNNLNKIIIVITSIIIIFIALQTYDYIENQNLKKTSIIFFDSIDEDSKFLKNINKFENENDIYGIFSKLKQIQINNKDKNFTLSNNLYKDIVTTKKLNQIYTSSISAHAAYTLINASYFENTAIYLDDINFYISKISNDLEDYFSIKKELEFLYIITETDIKNTDYANNIKALEIYNTIINSNLISSLIKERVKKIHEFQLYK